MCVQEKTGGLPFIGVGWCRYAASGAAHIRRNGPLYWSAGDDRTEKVSAAGPLRHSAHQVPQDKLRDFNSVLGNETDLFATLSRLCSSKHNHKNG